MTDRSASFYLFFAKHDPSVVGHSFIRLITPGQTYSALPTRHISLLLLNKYVTGCGMKWATLSLLPSLKTLRVMLGHFGKQNVE